MNLEICKKCFGLKKNNIYYVFVTQTHEDFGVLKISGLVNQDGNNDSKSILCNQVVNIKKLTYNDFNDFIMTESKQKKILNKIKEPSTTCKFYCEHVVEELNGKENYNGCEQIDL